MGGVEGIFLIFTLESRAKGVPCKEVGGKMYGGEKKKIKLKKKNFVSEKKLKVFYDWKSRTRRSYRKKTF